MFDSHAHVAFEQFDEDRTAVIERAHAAGLVGWLEVGTDLAQSKRASALAEATPGVYATAGLHPTDIAQFSEEVWLQLAELWQQPEVVAIGEVGLDVYRGGDLKAQMQILTRFLDVSVQVNKPVVFHVRSSETEDAHEALIKLLSSYPATVRGVVHTFSGTPEQAKQYLELGLYLSISGVVTFKNAADMKNVATVTPLERLLIETDCPFLSPEPNRGRRNEPAYVVEVAKQIAALRGSKLAALAEATQVNASQLFGIEL